MAENQKLSFSEFFGFVLETICFGNYLTICFGNFLHSLVEYLFFLALHYIVSLID